MNYRRLEGVCQTITMKLTRRLSTAALIKALGLAGFIAAALIILNFTPLRSYLTPTALSALLNQTGPLAPVSFIAFFALGTCLLIPGSIMTSLGAVIFGPYYGFLYVWIGAIIGSSLAFLIGRSLGRELAASLIGDRLKKYDQMIAQNGFATVLYLRLIYFPYTPMNFGMGLTAVTFQEYLAGTAIGVAVSTFVLTFLIGTFKTIILTGEWRSLVAVQPLAAVLLFCCSLVIPKFVKRIKARVASNE